MKFKRLVCTLLALVLVTGLFSQLPSEATVKAAENAWDSMRFAVNIAGVYYPLLSVNKNETLKMFKGQSHRTFYIGFEANFSITGDNDAVEITGSGPYYSIVANKTGKVHIDLSVPDDIEEGTINTFSFNIEVTDSFNEINTAFSKVKVYDKVTLKMNKDGSLTEYTGTYVKNEGTKTIKAVYYVGGPSNYNAGPGYKTIKKGKTKCISEYESGSYSNIKSAKKDLSLLKKQVKKLKAGKTVTISSKQTDFVLSKDPYSFEDIEAAFCYSGFYFIAIDPEYSE